MKEGETIEEYYIVRVKLREVKYFDGKVANAEGSDAVLSWTSEGGGWPQVLGGDSIMAAYRFEEPPTMEEIAKWDGMPWMYRFQPGSARIFKITDRKMFERHVSETEIPSAP